MKPSSEIFEWRVVGNPVFISGYAYGCRYPALMLNVAGHVLAADVRQSMSSLLERSFPLDDPRDQGLSETNVEDPWAASVAWFIAALHYLQNAGRLGVYERGRILALGTNKATCCVPIAMHAAKAVRSVAEELLGFVRQSTTDETLCSVPESLLHAMNDLAELRTTKPNVPRFLRAAFELGLPFQEIPGDLMQYGQGKRSRWLNSSLTDEASHISTSLARDKPLTVKMLKRAGLPTPVHRLVNSEDAAVEMAQQLGFPVVVKPADLDGGIGVSTNLTSPEDVRLAFRQATEHSSRILVEKHVAGRDYRLVVLHDEVVGAIERIPAGVFGDGEHTVQALVDLANADPRRGESPHALLKRLHLDDEAQGLLEDAGLSISSVPRSGEFVRLRRAGNIASGGMPVSVLEKVHPDNLRLAVRAAKALRLDFAGIDLLMEDIALSWKECRAVICEVNAQPNLGRITTAHLYAPILQKIVPGDGRIPITLILGAPPDGDLAQTIAFALRQAGFSTGCHDARGVRVDGEERMVGRISTFAAGTALAMDRTLGAMVVSIDDIATLRTGLPFARYDVLVLAGSYLRGVDPLGPSERQAIVIELFTSILSGCDGRVITAEGAGVDLRTLRRVTRAKWDETMVAPEKLVAEVVSEMQQCEMKHAYREGSLS